MTLLSRGRRSQKASDRSREEKLRGKEIEVGALAAQRHIEPDVFGCKEEAWFKFKEDLMDYSDAVHPGIKLQLEWTLKQKEEITQEVIGRNPLSSPAEDWPLRFDLFQADQAEDRVHLRSPQDRGVCRRLQRV